MNAFDFRNQTWADLQGRIFGDREKALRAWRAYGPGTTRAVAAAGGIDILTFRPRTTELVHLGFIECTGGQGHEGLYRARSDSEVSLEFNRRRIEAAPRQLDLGIKA